MKTKLLLCLLFFFSFSIISSSDPKPDEVSFDVSEAEPKWPAIPACTGRDNGTRKGSNQVAGYTKSAAGNPLESAFLEVSCLLAAN